MNVESPWTVYRSRFVVRARQLTEPLVFTDIFGREQSGQVGDYLVESPEGIRRIHARHLFEDIYVPLHPSPGTSPARGSTPDRASGVLAPPAPTQRLPTPAWSG
jgi:hypothetical protein